MKTKAQRRTIDPARIAEHVREVTDAELAFYREHGWVKLPGLISRELAAELLAAGLRWHERNERRTNEWLSMARAEVEPFRSLVFSERMGRNAQILMDHARLTGADAAVRYRTDHFVSREPGANGTGYHQDSTEHGTDRCGDQQFWIALAECTPEMGTMRFCDGVHREGPLGSAFAEQVDQLKSHPRLTELYPLTEALGYQPGDATVHHGFMIHGSEANRSDRTRYSAIISYVPATTRWWNGSVGNWGAQRKLLSDEKNPVIWPPAPQSGGDQAAPAAPPPPQAAPSPTSRSSSRRASSRAGRAAAAGRPAASGTAAAAPKRRRSRRR
jgi:hypothetical protein